MFLNNISFELQERLEKTMNPVLHSCRKTDSKSCQQDECRKQLSVLVEEVFSIFVVRRGLLETWHIFQVLEQEFSNVEYTYVCWSACKQFG